MSQPVLTSERLTLRAWDPDDDADVAAALEAHARAMAKYDGVFRALAK